MNALPNDPGRGPARRSTDRGAPQVVVVGGGHALQVRTTLEAGGMGVSLAKDALSAASLCFTGAVDAVVCGPTGDSGSAATLVETLRADGRTRGIPFVLLGGRERHPGAVEAGAEAALELSAPPGALLAEVEAAVSLKRLLEDLQRRNVDHYATTAHDPLTGLPERSGLAQACERLLQRARSRHEDLGLLVVDVDGMGYLNAAHGPFLADLAFVEVARRVSRTLRDDDVVGRWEGDRLVAVLPETDTDRAAKVAERVRSAVEERPVELVGVGDVLLTVSVGVAVGAPSATHVLVGAALASVAEAKAAGRNVVRVAPPQ